jgi:hypothetical protein
MEFYLTLNKGVKRVPNDDNIEVSYSVHFPSRYEYFAQSSAQIVLLPPLL